VGLDDITQKEKKEYMKFQNTKLTTLLLATLLIVSIGASVFAATANAATVKPTFAYVTAKPDTVGVGQTITIYTWVNQIFPGAAMTNDYRFHNFKIIITKPATQQKLWWLTQFRTPPQTKPSVTHQTQ
jgi:hypothetical protein